jgi:hypothetical protein
MNVKSPNNTNKWQMGFHSAFKGLKLLFYTDLKPDFSRSGLGTSEHGVLKKVL